ncbi:MAG: hypothetical protein N2446_02715 [Elusimicrobiales bacterium]|nr:hypothetical protein [Elusimicrobiales bacterium]
MQVNKFIKIFAYNVIIIIILSKTIPLLSKNISERIVDRILLLYLLVFNSILLYIILKKEKQTNNSK